MNTERDNFYDWAKDKPDTSSHAALNSAYSALRPPGHKSTMPWGKIVGWIVAGAAMVWGLKHYLL